MMGIRNFTFGSKLIAVMLGLCIPLVGVGLFLTAQQSADLVRDEMEKMTRAQAKTYAELLESPLTFGEFSGVEETLLKFMSNTEIREVMVVDSNGRVVGSSVRDGGEIHFPSKLGVQGYHGDFLFVTENVYQDQNGKSVVLGQVALKVSTNQREDNIKSGRSRIVFLFLLLMLISLGIAKIFQVLLTRPILKLAEASRAISESQDFSVRVEYDGGQDEVDVLYQSFNRMMERLELRQERLDWTNQRLRMSEERLAATLDSIADAVIATDASLKILTMNPVAEQLLDVSEGDAFRSEISKLVHIRTESNEGIDDIAAEVLDTRSQIHRWGGTHLLRDGKKKVQLSLTCSPLLNAAGEIDGVVLVLRDISEQLELEGELRHVQKMDSIGQLAGGIAHDFNNILAGIMGFAELVQSFKDEPDKVEYYSKSIAESADQAAGLTRQLLAYSRKGKVNFMNLDVHKLIESSVDILRHTMDRRTVIRLNLEAVHHSIVGDTSLIQSAILNLGVNGSDAMGGEGELTISTFNRSFSENSEMIPGVEIKPGRYLAIEVNDTGEGIPEDLQNKIFEPFFTTKSLGKGTGLGLAAVYGTVNEHGGFIDLESEVGNGSSFRLYFPINSQTAEVDETPEFSPTLANPHATGGTILIVEDEAPVRRVLEDSLVKAGYKVILANNGREGVEMWREHATDLNCILMDMIMPEMNGKDAIVEIRKDDSEIPIILISGYSETEDILQIRNEVSGILQKPFKPKNLIDILARVFPTQLG